MASRLRGHSFRLGFDWLETAFHMKRNIKGEVGQTGRVEDDEIILARDEQKHGHGYWCGKRCQVGESLSLPRTESNALLRTMPLVLSHACMSVSPPRVPYLGDGPNYSVRLDCEKLS